MKAKEISHRFGDFIRENRGKLALGLVAFGTLAALEWPHSRGSLVGLLDHMASGLLAFPTWELPTKHGLVELLTTGQSAEVFKWLSIDALYGVAGGLLHKGISGITNEAKERRKREGIEPIPKKISPKHVYVGPSEIISDLAQAKDQSASVKASVSGRKKEIIVGVHLDDKTPPVLGQEMGYHLRPGNLNEIVGRHAASTKRELSFIEASGMDRADEITIACYNPDNALFYSIQSQPQIPANFVSTLLRRITADKIKGKKVNVILPREEYFGETTPIEGELKLLASDLDFNLNIIRPENLVLEHLKKRIAKVYKEKASEEIEIVLAGEGKTLADELMLDRFRKALSEINIEGKRINVHLIAHDKYDGQSVSQLPKDKRDEMLKEILEKSLFNICYGDTDPGTSSVAELLIKIRKAERSQTLALVERTSMIYDFERAGIDYLSIYNMVLQEMIS